MSFVPKADLGNIQIHRQKWKRILDGPMKFHTQNDHIRHKNAPSLAFKNEKIKFWI